VTARVSIRRNLLAQIHIAKKQLGLDDETYRAMLWTVARVSSSKDAGDADLQRIVAHMTARGFKPQSSILNPRSSTEWSWVDTAAADRQPMLRKIIMQLKSAGRAKAYADGIAAAMFRIERLELCGARELRAIITALNKDAQRHPASPLTPHASRAS